MKTRSDEAVIDLLTPHMEAAKAYQNELAAERERFARSYRAEAYGNERDGFAKTVHPTVFTAVEWMKPGLYEVFTGDFFSLTALTSEGGPGVKAAKRESARRLKDYVRRKLFLEMDGGQVIEDFIHDALTGHFGAIKVTHREDKEVVAETLAGIGERELAALAADDPAVISVTRGRGEVQTDPVSGEPRIVYPKAVVKRERPRRSGFFVEAVPAREIYFPPGYKSLADCPFVAHVVRRDLDHVRRMELAGIYRKGAAEAAKAHINDHGQNPLVLAGSGAHPGIVFTSAVVNTGKELLPANEVLIWECYVKLDLDGSGLLTPCVVTLCGDAVLRGPEENPYGGPPFELGSIFREPHRLTGRPLAATLEHRQRVLTNLLRNIQDGAALSTYRGFLTTDMQTKKRLESFEPGSVAWVPNLNQIQEVGLNPPSSFILQAFDLTMQEVGKESGITENQMGLDTNTLNRTAAGMMLRLSAGQMRQKLYAHRLARTFKRVIGRILDVIRLFPPEPGQDFGTGLTSQDTAVTCLVDIEIGVGPQDRLNQAMSLNELIQTGLQAGLSAGIMDVAGLSRAIRAKYDYLDMDVSDYLLPEDDIPLIQKLSEHLGELAGENAGLKQALSEHLDGLRRQPAATPSPARHASRS